MVELVDTRDLKSLGLISRTGSSPVPGTIIERGWLCWLLFSFFEEIKR